MEELRRLGIRYMSIRGVDGRNIGDYSIEEIKTSIVPRLKEGKILVSSIGSPIGKILVDDDAAFEKQKEVLDTLCQGCVAMDCKYIRVFSFYIPENQNPDQYKEQVVAKMKSFTEVAEKYDVILLHENEKDIYGDIGIRCKTLLDEVDSPNFKGIFDFANFVQCQEDPQQCYDLLRDYIEYIHIKDAVFDDNQNVLCGTGDGKIPELLKAFVESGYKGFLTLEPHLVLFDSLKDLEVKGPTDIIKDNKGLTNEQGFEMQYRELMKIIDSL